MTRCLLDMYKYCEAQAMGQLFIIILTHSQICTVISITEYFQHVMHFIVSSVASTDKLH